MPDREVRPELRPLQRDRASRSSRGAAGRQNVMTLSAQRVQSVTSSRLERRASSMIMVSRMEAVMVRIHEFVDEGT